MTEYMKSKFIDDSIVSTIVGVVSSYYCISPTKIFELGRKGDRKKARQIIQYLIKKNTKKSLSEIGKVSLLYGRNRRHDHASILHSIKSVNNNKTTNKIYRQELEEIEINYKKKTDSLTELDIENIEKKDVQNHYEDLLSKKNIEIESLKSSILVIKNNLTFSTDNRYIKQLLVMDEEVINMFSETRLRPFLAMLKSQVTSSDLINKQLESRIN